MYNPATDASVKLLIRARSDNNHSPAHVIVQTQTVNGQSVSQRIYVNSAGQTVLMTTFVAGAGGVPINGN